MALTTYTVAFFVNVASGVLSVPGVKFAGDILISATIVSVNNISGLTNGADVTNAFDAIAPASEQLVTTGSPDIQGTTCIATMQTTKL